MVIAIYGESCEAKGKFLWHYDLYESGLEARPRGRSWRRGAATIPTCLSLKSLKSLSMEIVLYRQRLAWGWRGR